MGGPYNVPAPLAIPTYEGSGHSIHPAVVALDEPLGGYTHWMAFTPYPNGADEYENPSIVASDDGTTWVVPAGLTNPLDPIPGDPPMAGGSEYNSDTDLVHHDGTLYLFWRRYSTTTGETVYLRTSTDGVTWAPRQAVLNDPKAGRNIISPAVLCEPDGTWRIWYGNGNPATIQHRTGPGPTGPWSAPTACTVSGLESYRHVWHLDVIPWDGIYLGLWATTKSGTTNIDGALFCAVSEDGFTWQTGRCLIQPSRPAPGIPTRWDSGVIYRCTGVVDGTTLRLWYATDRRIGYTAVPTSEFTSALHALRH